MTEQTLDANVIKKTQNSLGKFVKKPALSEKLLKKPPFRFLHDIINAVIKDNGFLNGLYTTDELVSDNIKDREAKIQFLQKLIDVIKLVTGKELKARPSKIVAGLEAGKTNELLQAIGYALEKKLDSKDAIENYKNGETTPTKTEKTNTKASKTKDKEKEKIKIKVEKPAKIADKVEKEKPKLKTRKSVEKLEKTKSKESKLKKTGSEKSIDVEEIQRRKSIEKEVVNGLPPTDQVEDKKEENNQENVPNGNDELSNVIDEEAEMRRAEKLSRRTSLKKQGSLTANDSNLLSDLNQFNGLQSNSNSTEKSDEAILGEPVKNETESNEIKPLSRQQSTDNAIASAVRRTSLRPPSVRPPSARPGAPRRKERNVEIILQPNESLQAGEVNIKMEVFNSEILDDDGENLIVIEDPAVQNDDIFGTSNVDGSEGKGEDQGLLVQQILETQKEFSLVSNSNSNVELAKKADIEWNSSQRNSSAKQMETLRDSIQKLTRSVNPLGKLMDFIQEDIDSMERELTSWQDNYSQTLTELNKEKCLTENAIEPLRQHLVQIDVNIKEYKEMIDVSRANILQNETKIDKLYMEM